jgi:hypothetical protein
MPNWLLKRLTLLNKGMTRLSSNRKKEYFKIVESYLSNNDLKQSLKNVAFSRANIGKANSSPNNTTYELVKNKAGGKLLV